MSKEQREILCNPLDILEDFLVENQMECERHLESTLACLAHGAWGTYTLYFYWYKDLSAFEVVCLLDIPIDTTETPGIWELLSLVNAEVLVGHFEICDDLKLIAFRNTILYPEDDMPPVDTMEQMMDMAVFEGERLYPAFDFLINQGKNPGDALKMIMLNTVGEA